MPVDTTALVRSVLELRSWTAYDIDNEGRVLAAHDDTGSSQLVLIEPAGARIPLTALDRPCSGRFVPGRPQVVVQHDAGGNERMQLSVLDLDATARPATERDLVPLVHDPRFMHVLVDVTPTSLVYYTNRRNGVDMDVVLRDLDSGVEQVLYDNGGYVASATLSHDERSVALVIYSLRPNGTFVSLAGPDGIRDITDPQEDSFHGEQVGWAEGDRALVFASNRDREYLVIVRAPADGSAWSTLVADEAHDLTADVSPGGHALLVGTLEDGAYRYAVHEADGAWRCRVDMPPVAMPSVRWAPDNQHVLVAGIRPDDPGSIWLVDARTGAARSVIDGSEEMPPGVAGLLASPTSQLVPTPDGEQVPCFVYPPSPQGDPGLAGASVVHVHGGPEWAATRSFNPVVSALSAVGFTVVVPNVRGSTGYGKRWYMLDDVERRLDSVGDLAAVHAWLPTRGLDPARAALWGGSYGGYMVLAGLSMQPQLWAAGVDIVGTSSLVTFLENTSEYRRAYREREYGSLAQQRDMLERFSPLTYLDAIRAPLLVIHGANDPRVPLSEAEQIHAALQGRGIPCELRVYPDEGHGLAKRANRLDAYPAAIEFLRSVLARERPERSG
ncbi:MAG: alpha/beta fold hydrolase [Dermatophilaceae bacterium]